ncbi:MAG: type IV pilus biogenesis protein PilM [Desulfitobacteriaceae bacterium]
MFNKKLSLAVVKGQNWTIAEMTRNKSRIKVLRLAQFSTEFIENQQELENLEDAKLPNNGDLTSGSQEPVVKLNKWLKQQKISLKKLRLTYSCPGSITRIITLPQMSTKDLNKLLTEQVDQYFTLNIDDYLVDYRILDTFEEEGQKRQSILLAALPRFHWEQLCSTMEILGIKSIVVDLAADSLARLYGKLGYAKKPTKKFAAKNLDELYLKFDHLLKPAKKVAGGILARVYSKFGKLLKLSKKVDQLEVGSFDLAIVDLSAERVEFVILENGLFFLYSDQEIALELLKGLKRPIVLTESEENVAYDGEGLSQEQFDEELEDILTPVLRTLGGFITFFATKHFGKSLDKIFLTGEYADFPLIAEIFEKSLRVETQPGFPGEWKPDFGPEAQKNQQDWMKYGSLYGLALRED